MVRPPSIDSSTGMKKGAWSEDEDNKLKAYIQRYGHWNWRLLPKYAGLKRCGKSCRLRWVNYLKPGVKRGNFTKEEQELVIKLHVQLGNKWSAIAEKLPGRTDNEIKNFWHTRVERRRRPKPNPSLKKPTTKAPASPTTTNNLIKTTDHSSSEATSLSTDSQDQLEFMLSQILEADAQNNHECFAPEVEFDYPELRYTEVSCSGSGSGSSYVNKWTVDDEVCGSFWNESSNAESETTSTSSYTTAFPLEEEGLLYYDIDPLLQYLDYDTNLF